MAEKLPIVLIHKGNSSYLPYTLYQLRKFHPLNEIFLIGDDKNAMYNGLVTHKYITDYSHNKKDLEMVYSHKSTLGYDFEFFCIFRWFVLNNFIRESGFKSALYLDSDILVYDNLDDVFKEVPEAPMSFLGFSAHTNRIQDKEALNDFCVFVLDVFSGKTDLASVKDSLYRRILNKELDMNISDMVFFFDYNLWYPNRLLDLSKYNSDKMFDTSMDDTRYFEASSNNSKSLIWKSKQPHTIRKEDGHLVFMHTLHFQGSSKSLLRECFLFDKDINFILLRLRYFFSVIENKIIK